MTRKRQIILFRALAVLLGLTIVCAAEGVLRLTPIGRMRDIGDPYVGLSDTVPLFSLNDTSKRFEIPKARQVFFRPESFSAEKGKNEFRIFCFGGSTVQGRPYAIETSFTRWLELSLRAADASREWRVINCGGISYASYRLIPILQETIAYKPDLFIVYTGQNEFLEARTYGDLKRQPEWVKAFYERVFRLRIYGLAHQWLGPLLGKQQRLPSSDRSTLPEEVDALLDYQGGLSDYHRDDQWQDGVMQHYEFNLRRMIRTARDAGIPILLANPVSNIRDTTPFKVEPPADWTAEQKQAFDSIWNDATTASWDDLPQKLALAQKAVDADPRNANTHFLLAKVHESMGNQQAATRSYLRAKDEDVCPLRMLEPMHSSVKAVAKQTSTPLIDVRQLFEQRAEFGVPGDDELIDHVHPRINGHQLIADLFFEHLIKMGIVSKSADWETRRKELYRENFESLPNNYFPESMARLEGLQKWSQGRASKLKVEARDR